MVDALNSRAGDIPAETRALLILQQTPGVGPSRIRALVGAFGSAAASLAVSRRAFTEVVGDKIARARQDRSVPRAVDEGLARAGELGMTVLSWNERTYPAGLQALADPPPVLFLRGRVDLLSAGGVTIVGSRRATARGREIGERLGEALARAGRTVLSGMALGVDGAAHSGALAGGGGTVAVLGRGADEPYPRSHGRLFRGIVERGLVVSEFLPGTPPLNHHFPRRNRILAALADVVVVVEAAERSGALITVDHALDLGRDVWSVPGPIDTPACVGSNLLIADGARPLVSIDSFVRELTGADLPSGTEPALQAEIPDGPEGALLRTLQAGPMHVDALAARAGLAVPRALALLAALELRGSVEQLPGLRFKRAA